MCTNDLQMTKRTFLRKLVIEMLQSNKKGLTTSKGRLSKNENSPSEKQTKCRLWHTRTTIRCKKWHRKMC